MPTASCSLLFVVALAAGCAPVAANSSDFRSPSHDYPAPARTTADGEPMGADRRPATDTLDQNQPPPAPEESSK